MAALQVGDSEEKRTGVGAINTEAARLIFDKDQRPKMIRHSNEQR
jgi:hypothetical protein